MLCQKTGITGAYVQKIYSVSDYLKIRKGHPLEWRMQNWVPSGNRWSLCCIVEAEAGRSCGCWAGEEDAQGRVVGWLLKVSRGCLVRVAVGLDEVSLVEPLDGACAWPRHGARLPQPLDHAHHRRRPVKRHLKVGREKTRADARAENAMRGSGGRTVM